MPVYAKVGGEAAFKSEIRFKHQTLYGFRDVGGLDLGSFVFMNRRKGKNETFVLFGLRYFYTCLP